jgi:cell division protein FtsW
MSAVGASGTTRSARRVAPPLEHRILMTATLCLLAFGAVMVYSASSSESVITSGGYGTSEFFMYLVAAAIGIAVMKIAETRGLTLVTERLLRLMLMAAFALMLLVLVPHIGISVNGARRWFGAGPIQFQPSELMTVTLVMYVARYLADNERRVDRGFKQAVMPLAVVIGPACLLIAVEPDLGTTLVVFFTMMAMLLAAGFPSKYLWRILGVAAVVALIFILAEPYQRARLGAFLHPFSVAGSSGYQSVQGQIAIGSGGIFGVGLGKGVQQAFWLPEAQTDFILAVVGEELGLLGVAGIIFLYGLIAYAGFRTARRAATRYTKLLASGLTSLILCQGLLNIFVVLGIAPLTGVPLPFISYAPTDLIVMLGSVGLLMGISRPAANELRLVDNDSSRSRTKADSDDTDRDRRRRDRWARRAGAGGSRRAAS